MRIEKLHHIAIICSYYELSKELYKKFLDFKVESEVYRSSRESCKLDLSLNGEYLIELFSFPNPPSRSSFPEATGLRDIAFNVSDLYNWVRHLISNDVICEHIRLDEFKGKRFTFFSDPDKLPI